MKAKENGAAAAAMERPAAPAQSAGTEQMRVLELANKQLQSQLGELVGVNARLLAALELRTRDLAQAKAALAAAREAAIRDAAGVGKGEAKPRPDGRRKGKSGNGAAASR